MSSIPPNILYVLLCFLLTDIVHQMQMLMFSTLADIVTEMNNHTLREHFNMEPTQTSVSFLNSVAMSVSKVGMISSLYLFFPFAETKGRKFVVIYIRAIILFACSLSFFLSAIYQASEFFILGQFLAGLNGPIRMCLVIMYITECTPDKNRGFAAVALIFSNVIGDTIMFSLATPAMFGTKDTWFVFPLVLMISTVILFFMSIRLPESPKWLVRQNRMEEAADSIKFYHGVIENEIIDETLMSFVKEKNLTKEDRIGLRQIWENDTMRQALLVVSALLIIPIFDSEIIQRVYLISLNKAAGFSVQQALNISLILSLVFFPSKFIGTFLIDYLGRRPMMCAAIIMIFTKSCLMLATQFVIFWAGASTLTQILLVVVECMTDASVATGIRSMGMLLIAELFPPSARTSVAQVLMLVPMLINFPIMSIYPIISSIFAPAFFMPQPVAQLFLGFYLYRHMPETKARAVCDIIESLDQEVASRSGTFLDEKSPLIRIRARTLAEKRNSILITSRTRALTGDWKC